mmetsp:Transcript_11590/g.31021  ORF Transcript_11590/g.31021 Transcript_11590/m.31021 type:complete len:362 (+) Transcript_11590:72-1157(+)
MGRSIVGAVLLSCCVRGAVARLPHNLWNITYLAQTAPELLMAEIRASPLRAVVREVGPPLALNATGALAAAALPTVTAHGIGDSCWNSGFKSVTRGIGAKTGTYARCVPTAGNIITDTIAGFLKNMDSSVDYFAAKIREDPKLQGGFNAIGFSQGNSLIRGYIQKYNDPPVNAFVSVHGTVMGVAAYPNCFEQGRPLGLLCKALAEVLGDLAYLPAIQDVLFPADYYRAATKVGTESYFKNSQLSHWNNEDPTSANATFKSNFAKTKRFAMVKAAEDNMVYPNEGEWWGAMEDGEYGKALTMKETRLYQEDSFGLKTADEAGKIFFESTSGEHLEFTDEQLYGWVQKYFMEEPVGSQPVVV